MGGWDLVVVFFLKFNLYISPGLMFCFLVIFQDLFILFIYKINSSLHKFVKTFLLHLWYNK